MSKYIIFIGLLFLQIACKKDDVVTTTTTSEVPAIYKKIYGATSVSLDGNFVVIKSTGSPDHKSIYYPTSNALYENFSGTTFGGVTFRKNPNTIATYNYVFKIPVKPAKATTNSPTALGAIGVSLNGVPFYNQYAGPNQPLTNEIMSFDQYRGHPTGNGNYHYHVEPTYLTTVKSTKVGLLGFLLDGFPVYGPQEENGKTVTNTDLDQFHGHSHNTADFPNGIYHYHFTDQDPYLNGNGYYGSPGTVTQ